MLPDEGHKLDYKLEKDVNHVFRTVQRLLSAYKDEKRGPTYIAVQSPLGNSLPAEHVQYVIHVLCIHDPFIYCN